MASYQQHRHHQQQHQEECEFGTVLAARDNNEPPKELEVELRRCCQRLRVVSNLTGGAHFLFKVSDASVAVRVYDAKDAVEIEKKWLDGGVDPELWTKKVVPRRPTEGINSNESKESRAAGSDQQEDDDVVVGLQTFRDSFMHTVIFFVLPPGEMQRDQLSKGDSFLSVAQRALVSTKTTTRQDPQQKEVPKRPVGSSRVFIVPDTKSLRSILKSVVESISPEKRALKEKFFAAQRKANFLPDQATGLPVSDDAVASHVANAFRSWADRFGLPHGEADVIMSVLGSLGPIATADKEALDRVPISDEAKNAILDFFASTPSSMDTSHSDPNVDGSQCAADFDTNSGYGTDLQATGQQYQDTLNHTIEAFSLPNQELPAGRSMLQSQSVPVTDATPRVMGPGIISNISGDAVDFTPMHFQASTTNPTYPHGSELHHNAGMMHTTPNFGGSVMPPSSSYGEQSSPYGSSQARGRSPHPSYGQQSPHGSSHAYGGRSPYQRAPARAYANTAQFGNNFQGGSQFNSNSVRGRTAQAMHTQRGTGYAPTSAPYRNHSGYYP